MTDVDRDIVGYTWTSSIWVCEDHQDGLKYLVKSTLEWSFTDSLLCPNNIMKSVKENMTLFACCLQYVIS